MFSTLNIKLIIASVVVALILGLSVYIKILSTEVEKAELINKNLLSKTESLSNDLTEQTKSIQKMIKEKDQLVDNNIKLNKSVSELKTKKKEKTKTINKLNEVMLLKKRTLLESKINKATKKVFEDIENEF